MNNFDEFTEHGYRALLEQLKTADYRFIRFGETLNTRHVIWRHDVDFSMHRAARLAEVEATMNVTATYFVNPHSAFYNLFEPEVMSLVRKIGMLGHEIGLHFDCLQKSGRWTFEALEAAIARDHRLIQTMFEIPIRTVSWHNPDLSNLLEFDADEVGGLVSAYSSRLKRDYVYCSDSNGYWRFKPMSQIISEGHERLHLLTHPGWWTPEPMAPSDRVNRAISGRASKVRQQYDDLLKQGGRQNIVASSTAR